MTKTPRSSRITLSAMIAIAAALLAGPGCGGGPKLVPVSGTITLNGKPLEDAEVSFIPFPENPDPKTPGADRTGPEGNYKPKYNGRFGLAPGKYKVLVSKTAVAITNLNLPKEIMMDREQQELAGIRKQELPKKYSEGAESTEICEVPPEGTVFDMDIKAAKKS